QERASRHGKPQPAHQTRRNEVESRRNWRCCTCDDCRRTANTNVAQRIELLIRERTRSDVRYRPTDKSGFHRNPLAQRTSRKAFKRECGTDCRGKQRQRNDRLARLRLQIERQLAFECAAATALPTSFDPVLRPHTIEANTKEAGQESHQL